MICLLTGPVTGKNGQTPNMGDFIEKKKRTQWPEGANVDPILQDKSSKVSGRFQAPG